MSARRLKERLTSGRRGGWQPRAIIALAVVWVLLWDRVTLGNAVNGLIIGAVITQLFPLPSIQYFGRIRPWRMFLLIVRFFYDLVPAAVLIAIATLSPNTQRGGSIVEVRLRTHSEFYMTIVATIVSLVPGSFVVEARRSANVLYVHWFDVTSEEAVADIRANVLAVETRVVRAIGSDEEIALVTEDKEAA